MLQTRRAITLLLLAFTLSLGGCGAGDQGPQGIAGAAGPAGAPGAPGTNADAIATIGEGAIIIDGAAAGDPKESIYVRKIGQAGTDRTGHVWADGDWVTVTNDAAGLAGTEFQQRSWQGDQRTYANVQATWDAVVYNDILKYDISKAFTPAAVTDPTFRASPSYSNSLLDGFNIQYMPESLYYSHKFNVSPVAVVKPTPNADGSVVTIPGDGRMATLFTGKRTLLVKATTDFAKWRGDQVIYDNYTATTKYDLKHAGADVTAVMIGADQGFDHGFPVAKPLQTVRLIDAFVKGNLTAGAAGSALGNAQVALYPNSETAWETNTFTGF